MAVKGYIGSYATDESQVLLQFVFDETTEEFLDVKEVLPYADSKYLYVDENDVITLFREDEKSGVAVLHKDSSLIEHVEDETVTSCYVIGDETYFYTANYHEGTVSIYSRNDGLKLYKRISIRDKAGCHQVILHENEMLVPCLIMDTIRIYDRSKDFAFVKEISFPKGSGPRHGVFDHDGHFYVISELSNQLFIFKTANGNYELQNFINLLEDDSVQAAGAAIRMSDDERFVYMSIRDVNQIIVFDIETQTIIQRLDAGGDHPRDIALTPDMHYLFVMNRFTSNVCVYKRDQKHGTLTRCSAQMKAVQGVCIQFEKQEELI